MLAVFQQIFANAAVASDQHRGDGAVDNEARGDEVPAAGRGPFRVDAEYSTHAAVGFEIGGAIQRVHGDVEPAGAGGHVLALLAGVTGDAVDTEQALLEQFVGPDVGGQLLVACGVDRLAMTAFRQNRRPNVRGGFRDGVDDLCHSRVGGRRRRVE